MNKKLNLIFKKKKIYKIILYLFLFILFIFFVYFFIPKFFDYSPKLIEESLKKNSNFNIKNISNINYRFFPSPRLRLSANNLGLEEDILEVEDAEIDIILNPSRLFNYKKLHYDKLLIRGGSTNIKINKAIQLLSYIKKNKKKINFKKNTIILLQKNKKLFEINNSIIKINYKNNIEELSVNGLLLNNKISFLLKNKDKNKTSIILKIPELDISTNISLRNEDNFKTFEGLVDLVILNNFFQFNLVKEKKIIINRGFVRNNLINSSFEGEISFKPHFFFNLDINPSKVNIKKIFFIIKKKYFSEDLSGLEIIKKINGSLNFKNIFEGNVIFENNKILFQNFKIGKDASIFFDAKISELGKKGKIEFNLFKNIRHKVNSNKELKISGFITPFSSKVTFEQIVLDKEIFTAKKIKNYEKKFKKEVINNSLSNIFNVLRISNFFKNFDN